MRALPMKERLSGKKVRGYLWTGPGESWRKKENYFQLEHDKLVTAVFASSSGSFWVRCKGAACEVKLYSREGQILSTTVIALPHGRK
jgi:hypothetical protein